MTIYEAIETLSEIRCQYNCFDEREEPYYKALSMAIKALKNMKIMCCFDRDSEEYDCD